MLIFNYYYLVKIKIQISLICSFSFKQSHSSRVSVHGSFLKFSKCSHVHVTTMPIIAGSKPCITIEFGCSSGNPVALSNLDLAVGIRH